MEYRNDLFKALIAELQSNDPELIEAEAAKIAQDIIRDKEPPFLAVPVGDPKGPMWVYRT